MSNEMIGILAVGGLVVLAIIYFLHTAKGKAEAATLEAKINTGLASIESRLGMVHAAVLAPVQVVSVPTPVAAPVAPAAPQTVVWDNTGKTLAQWQAFWAANPYPTNIVGPNGYPVGTAGQELIPSGAPVAAFDPVAFGKAQGTAYIVTLTTASPAASFQFPMEPGNYAIQIGTGNKVHGSILDAAGNLVATDSGATFNVPVSATYTFKTDLMPAFPAGEGQFALGKR